MKTLLICMMFVVLSGCVSSREYQKLGRENNIIREAWCEDNHLWDIVQKNVTDSQWKAIMKEYRTGILSNKSGCSFNR